ncbi:MAG: O-antigen ligase family protein [Vicinamibacterales bacterium]
MTPAGTGAATAGGGDRLEFTGYLLIAACLGVVQFSIFIAQSVLLTLAVLVWIVVAVRDRRRPDVPAFFLPLLVYAALTLVSSAVSVDPVESFIDSKQLLLWLMVPVVARFARGDRAMHVIDVIIALGAAGAVYGIVQSRLLGFDNLGNRPAGSLSSYMTYSGVLMLVTCAAVARLVFYRREWIWPAIALPALIVALGFTLTRNAWIGTAVALMVLLALRQWKLVLIVPVLGLALVAVAPGYVRARVASMGDPNDPVRIDRIAMLEVGRGMVAAHPFFGVGPEMVQREYVKYRPPVYTNETNPHLHNVPVQIAAERGLPALAAWLWFVVAAGLDLLRQARRGPYRSVAAAGLAALVAMLAAGLFEYNFGDSEFLMLLLGLLTLPYAAAHGAGVVADGAGAAPAGDATPAPRRTEPAAG